MYFLNKIFQIDNIQLLFYLYEGKYIFFIQLRIKKNNFKYV